MKKSERQKIKISFTEFLSIFVEPITIIVLAIWGGKQGYKYWLKQKKEEGLYYRSYDFPKEWLKSTPISSVGLKIQGTNLALLYADSKLNGQDPEFFRSGGVSAPVPKQFTLTLKVGF